MTEPSPTLDRFLTRSEERALLRTVRRVDCPLARRDAAWMVLMRHTGVRVQERSRLTVGDAQLALRSHRLVLRAAIQKRRRGHEVPINRAARAALRALLAVRRELGLPPQPHAPLVVSRRGGRLAVRTFQHRMGYWRLLAGLQVSATPHWWRHTLGQRLVETSTAREPLLIVQRALGHADLRTTAVYARPTREDVALALEGAA